MRYSLVFSFLLILLIILYYNSRVYSNYSLENFQNYNDDEIYSNRKIVASYYINDQNISKLKDIIDLIVKL
jgi:Na+-transporting methylmalonyl-CoA/oxaloacetate decarboxylase gamma subunit